MITILQFRNTREVLEKRTQVQDIGNCPNFQKEGKKI